MKTAIYSSRTADKFVVRLPDGMRERIADHAHNNHRSMNSEIISRLEASMAADENNDSEQSSNGWRNHTGTVALTIGMVILHKPTGKVGVVKGASLIKKANLETSLNVRIETGESVLDGQPYISDALDQFEPILV